ncbi:MAG: hypothetical protein KVP17_002288 [Porospora cf. gigantea B]|uniref:uncharacterized protein n=1 Tax=Porospora cf. gigantea B TaxID=2853592 RepID=UPI003571E6C5|nr:MAG: hypothetical protein KVP17_002288 [Porospora cf. gigantea B]
MKTDLLLSSAVAIASVFSFDSFSDFVGSDEDLRQNAPPLKLDGGLNIGPPVRKRLPPRKRNRERHHLVFSNPLYNHVEGAEPFPEFDDAVKGHISPTLTHCYYSAATLANNKPLKHGPATRPNEDSAMAGVFFLRNDAAAVLNKEFKPDAEIPVVRAHVTIVADGHGDHNVARVLSKAAVWHSFRFFTSNHTQAAVQKITFRKHPEPFKRLLIQLVDHIQERLIIDPLTRPHMRSAGSTFSVSLLFSLADGRRLVVSGALGDSRIYRITYSTNDMRRQVSSSGFLTADQNATNKEERRRMFSLVKYRLQQAYPPVLPHSPALDLAALERRVVEESLPTVLCSGTLVVAEGNSDDRGSILQRLGDAAAFSGQWTMCITFYEKYVGWASLPSLRASALQPTGGLGDISPLSFLRRYRLEERDIDFRILTPTPNCHTLLINGSDGLWDAHSSIGRTGGGLLEAVPSGYLGSAASLLTAWAYERSAKRQRDDTTAGTLFVPNACELR